MISLTLNWFGIAMHNMPAAAQFYSNQLGLSFQEDAEKGLWRYFETRRMVFELFAAQPARIHIEGWGRGQAFRPAFLVNDLSTVEAHLQQIGVPVSREASEFGSRLEMTGPESLRLSFVESQDVVTDWAHPLVGGIELKAAQLEAQRNFYVEVLGMSVAQRKGQAIHLTQTNGEAWLRMEPGGMPLSLPPEAGSRRPAFFYQIWISFETPDVTCAKDWLEGHDVKILQPLTHHEDWGGTDIIIADVDGNAIEIVQYQR
jgi:predicted enzyme related to lactoylglutathione lyase